MTITSKEAASHLRKALNNTAVNSADDVGGLRFAVRATKTGVNVTIEDEGYVDRVTGGDPMSFGSEHKAPIVAWVEHARTVLFDPPLPGKTEWGSIIISATPIRSYTIGAG